ncbi:hypothetical protein [Roseateles cavernae]|uniref:hypothetical protein n=1 Tax=Roseateles cavernae TaxID=3153578 RepID=UPI0032E3EF62
MSAEVAKLLAQQRAQRESWCELRPAGDGKPQLRVLLLRPLEGETHRFTRRPDQAYASLMHDLVSDYAVGWEGFSAAELLGPANGSSDPLPFASALWAAFSLDRSDWILAAFNHLVAAINAHNEAREAAAKN